MSDDELGKYFQEDGPPTSEDHDKDQQDLHVDVAVEHDSSVDVSVDDNPSMDVSADEPSSQV